MTCPGTVVKVVNSYAAATHDYQYFFSLPFTQRQEDRHEPSECWPVNLLINVLFPTDGKPMNPLALVSVSATQLCTN